MYKNITALFLLVLSISAYAQKFATNWEKKSSDGTLPAWFTAGNNNVRCLAYGNGHLYLVQRNSGETIKVVNPVDGSDFATLNNGTGIITAATYKLNDVEVSSNGEIFACNLTTNASTTAFKVYRWINESATPVAVISYTGLAKRMGDYIYVSGSTADNSAVIYAAAATSNNIVVFTTSDHGASWTPTVLNLSGTGSTMSGGPCVAPCSSGFWTKSGGNSINFYNNSGNYTSTISGGLISTANVSLKYFESGSKKYVATIKYGGTVADNYLALVDVTAGAASANLYGNTPSLGSYNNAANGSDAAITDNGDGTATIFVLSPGNGFGCYTTIDPLPVELSSFSACINENNVDLNWETSTELNNYGFEIERSSVLQNSPETNWSNIGFVKGSGNSNSPRSYSFNDSPVAGRYLYRLKQIDNDGKFEYSGQVEVSVTNIPETYELLQNYPNPFNPATTISYRIPENTNVILKIYDLMGREVSTLVNEKQEAGTYSVNFEAAGLSSGMYIAKLITDSFSKTMKMQLLK